VPAEVTEFATDPTGLVAELDDLFGAGVSTPGIDFTGAAPGQLVRVFTFTVDFSAGVGTEIPVERQNLWAAPVAVDGDPLGVAFIGIKATTIAPELTDFDRDPSLSAALVDVPADTYLVRDDQHAAWFTLAAGELTPIVAGDSGVAVPTTLASFQSQLAPGEADGAASEPALETALGGGLATSIIAIAVALGGVALILAIPVLRSRRAQRPPLEDE
jgi:hypothetical protein